MEAISKELMLMNVMALANILLGLFVEGFFAAKRAEVICLSVVRGLAGRGRWVNVHAADRILDCSCHTIFLLFLLIMPVKYCQAER